MLVIPEVLDTVCSLHKVQYSIFVYLRYKLYICLTYHLHLFETYIYKIFLSIVIINVNFDINYFDLI